MHTIPTGTTRFQRSVSESTFAYLTAGPSVILLVPKWGLKLKAEIEGLLRGEEKEMKRKEEEKEGQDRIRRNRRECHEINFLLWPCPRFPNHVPLSLAHYQILAKLLSR